MSYAQCDQLQGQPEAFGLHLLVVHPDSAEWLSKESPYDDARMHDVDADGHHTSFEVAPMPGYALLMATLQMGMSPTSAAAALRKLADRLEAHGKGLLNLPPGQTGYFVSDGSVEHDQDRYGAEP